MEEMNLAPKRNRTPSHLKNLATYLKQHPDGVDFRLQDWLRTLQNEDLARIRKDLNSIYDSFITKAPMPKPARDIANAACLAYGAENPDIEAELVVKHLTVLLRGMKDAVSIEVMARCGWVMLTERVSIWPHTSRPYQVTKRGRVEGEILESPRMRALLGLGPRLNSAEARS